MDTTIWSKAWPEPGRSKSDPIPPGTQLLSQLPLVNSMLGFGVLAGSSPLDEPSEPEIGKQDAYFHFLERGAPFCRECHLQN